MKRLPPFELAQPRSVAEAVALLGAAGSEGRALAGGTDLLVDLKLGLARPRLLVDLQGIPGLDLIERVAGGLRIGALARVDALAGSAAVRSGHHALWQAAGVLGSPPIRHLATVGGNLGRGSPASDLLPALMVHGARAAAEGPGGSREIPVEALPTGPGATCLRPGEIVTSVLVPDAPERTGAAHQKVGRRGGGWDLALVGVSASLTLAADGTVSEAHLALASVGPTVRRAREAEARLRGASPGDDVLAAAADAAAEEAQPLSDFRATADYRRRLIRVLTRRVLRAALEHARAEGGAR